MKAHRRIVAAATMALGVALVAGPAYASDPPKTEVEIEDSKADISTSPRCYSLDVEGDDNAAAFGLGLIGLGLSNTEVLNLENVLNCNPILSDIDVLSNES